MQNNRPRSLVRSKLEIAWSLYQDTDKNLHRLTRAAFVAKSLRATGEFSVNESYEYAIAVSKWDGV